MKVFLGFGVVLVLFALYMDSRVPDTVVEHRVRVVALTIAVAPVRLLENIFERYLDYGHYTWYRFSPVLAIQMDNGKVKAYDDIINGVPVRVYTPYLLLDSKTSSGIIYYHGGGFCTLSVDLYHLPMLEMAEKSNSVVISVEYRLAPEHPFPAGLNDCLAVTKHIADNSAKYGISREKIYIAGDSAGGNFAATINGEEARDFPIKGVILICPLMQLATLNLPSHRTQQHTLAKFVATYFNVSAGKHHKTIAADHHICKDKTSTQVFSTYLSTAPFRSQCDAELYKMMAEVLNKRASPLFNPNLKGLSPTLLLLAEADGLRDEGILYYNRLVREGVGTQKVIYKSAIHGFFSVIGPLVQPTQYNEAMDDIAQYIKTGKVA